MTYAATLMVMARLSVDTAFREAFLQDAGRALEWADLSPNEQNALCSLAPETVVLLGRIYDFHREIRITEHLPWARSAQHPFVRDCLRRYARVTTPQLTNRDEARAFCRFVEEQEPPQELGYLRDLARFERIRIEVAWGQLATQGPIAFGWPVEEILQSIGETGMPQRERLPTHYAFKKAPLLPAVLTRVAPPPASG